MADSKPVPQLKERGFERVEAGFPGGWFTDGTWTVCVETRQRGGGMSARSTLEHEVRVFASPPGALHLKLTPAAVETDTSHDAALRRALETAGVDEEVTA